MRSAVDCEAEAVGIGSTGPSPEQVKAIDWSRQYLKGLTVARSSSLKGSWIWDFGWRLADKNGRDFWLCKDCHSRRRQNKHLYNADEQTSAANRHLKVVHSRNKDGLIPHGERGRKRTVSDYHHLPPDASQATINTLATAFNAVSFRSLLLQWIVLDHIAFRKIDSAAFRDFVRYLNPLAAPCVPSHQTVALWLQNAYGAFAGVVTELLSSALSMIHLSFDLWTSGNSLSLAGIVVHFVDRRGKIWNFLLGLPAHHDAHSGHNIAETVAAVIAHWNIQDSIGYFTADNASNNDTCLEWLAAEFGFDAQKRRVRCVGHILNLVAKAVMVGGGESLEAFEQELGSSARDDREALLLWRRRGPVGKLHNIVVYICRSTQRIALFEMSIRRHLHRIAVHRRSLPSDPRQRYEMELFVCDD